MRKRWCLLAAAAAALMTGAAAAQDAGDQSTGAQDVAPLSVAVAPVRVQDAADVVERFPGVTAPRRESQLGFEVGGVLETVIVDVGDAVVAGDALAALDLRSLDAQIAAAEASVRQAEANAKLAALTAERQRKLAGRGNAPEQALDDAAANAEVTVAAAEAARAELARLKVRRDLSILSAPYDGVITERYLDEGAIAASGAPVLDIAEADRLEIRVGLPRESARGLTVGRSYAFDVDGARIEAVLRGVTNIVDRRSQTVAAVFDAVDADVTPGAVARLRLTGALEAEGFWAPVTALSVGRRGLWTVMIAAPEDGAGGLYGLERRLVEMVYTEADRAYVRGAARDGELLVVSGLDRVTPGQRVRVSAEADAEDAPRRVAARRRP